jgi:quercetin dioxygenase-like cupin family protein
MQEQEEDVMTRASLLFLTLAMGLALSTAAWSELPYDGEGHTMFNADELEWEPIASMPPGAMMAVIEGDLSEQEPFTFRLHLPADYELAPHTHPAHERLTVISGTIHFGHGREFDRERTMELQPGGMALMAPGEPMFGYTEEETVIQLHGTGPWGIEYVNPEDDPRK